MLSDLELIRAIAHGAMEVKEENGCFVLSRYSAEQLKAFDGMERHRPRANSLASVHLDFETDAGWFSLEYANCENATFRTFFFFDLFIDGVLYAHKGYHTPLRRPDEAVQCPPDGKLIFDLPMGKKRVSLYFPALYHIELKSLEFPDRAVVAPISHPHTLLAFGDSITEGHDSEYAGMDYIDQFARATDSELYNFAIAGSCFSPDCIVPGSFPECDRVLVSYGTNDYRHSTKERFFKAMPEFFSRLHREFPQKPVYVILPIWRKGEEISHEIGSLAEVRAHIRKEAEKYPEFTVLDGAGFVPHLPDFFQDRSLHPNTSGHSLYASALAGEVLKKECE